MSSPPADQILQVDDSHLPMTKQLAGPTIKYPPFPPVPEGVKITPFKDFKERGIQMFSTGEDDVEVDGLGIPTIPLRVPHETDEGKTDARKRTKNPMVASPPPTSPPQNQPHAHFIRKEWWQYWQEGEDLRVTSEGYDIHKNRMDRIYQAAHDFRMGRRWPPAHTQIMYLWDQFRIFVGLLGVTPVWTHTDRPQDQSDDEDNISDDESDIEAELYPKKKVFVQQDSTAEEQPYWKKKKAYIRHRPPYTYYGKQPIPVDSEEAVRELLYAETLRKEEQLNTFMNNPEKTIKIFFSWYMRREALMWTERFLEALPRLVIFFLNFLLRNRVLQEVEEQYERGVRKAVGVAHQAFKELPLTSKIAKRLPDEFSLSCTACWGQELKDELEPKAEETEETTYEDPMKKFEEEVKAANMHLIEPSADMSPGELVKQIYEDNADGTVEVIDENNIDPTAFKWGWDDDQGDQWAAPDPHSLMALLGPTALPLTHTPGVIENSVRRITSFTPPPQHFPKLAHSSEPDADAVEVELQRRFAKVVLSPWAGWNDGGEFPDYEEPNILREPAGKEGEVKRHDAQKDDITILVDPSVLSILSEGMGLAGKWVQLARLPTAKKGKKSKSPPTSYWYVQEMNAALPSFWTVPEVIPPLYPEGAS